MKLDPDSPMYLAARFFPKAPCDLHSKLPTRCSSETKCRVRPYWTLACPQSTCSGWDGCSSQQHSSNVDSSFALPPAGFLHTDTRVHHKSQDSPSRGAVAGHSTQASTRAHNAAKQQIPKRQVLTTERSSGVHSSYTQSDDTLI